MWMPPQVYIISRAYMSIIQLTWQFQAIALINLRGRRVADMHVTLSGLHDSWLFLHCFYASCLCYQSSCFIACFCCGHSATWMSLSCTFIHDLFMIGVPCLCCFVLKRSCLDFYASRFHSQQNGNEVAQFKGVVTSK